MGQCKAHKTNVKTHASWHGASSVQRACSQCPASLRGMNEEMNAIMKNTTAATGIVHLRQFLWDERGSVMMMMLLMMTMMVASIILIHRASLHSHPLAPRRRQAAAPLLRRCGLVKEVSRLWLEPLQ